MSWLQAEAACWRAVSIHHRAACGSPLSLGIHALTLETRWPPSLLPSPTGTFLSRNRPQRTLSATSPLLPFLGGICSLYPGSHRSCSPATSTEDCLLEANGFSHSGLHTPTPEGHMSSCHPPAWCPGTQGGTLLSLPEPEFPLP